MEHPPDAGVARWAHVRRPSLAELYRTHSPGAVRLAYVLTGDLETARDLVQDAFVRLFGRYRDLRDADHFEAYLRRTVVNLSKNHYRASARARTFQAGQRPDDPTSEDDPNDDMRVALMRLPERQRAAVALRYLEDLSEQQAADAMDTTVPALKSLTHRGIKALREQMEGER